MKKRLFAALIILFSFSACGDDAQEDKIEPEVTVQVKDSLTTIKGDFIYLADAAVLKGKDFIYGVELDSISMKLADSVAPFKKDNFDMVPVTVRAKIINNPGRRLGRNSTN